MHTGYAGVVRFGGLRIAGLSGIFKARDYARGHFEHPPYNEDTKRSCYHIRNVDVFRLKQVKSLKCIDVDVPVPFLLTKTKTFVSKKLRFLLTVTTHKTKTLLKMMTK